MIKMKALIIAAGQGKRLRPIGDTKPLVTLLGLARRNKSNSKLI